MKGARPASRFGLAGVGLLLTILALVLPVAVNLILLGLLAAALLAGAALFLAPIGKVARGNDEPTARTDRARHHVCAGTADPRQPAARGILRRASRAPGRRRPDPGLPGLLSPEAKKAHPLHFAAAEACFAVPAALREWVDGPMAPVSRTFAPDAITVYLKGLAQYYGARSVGVTELRPYHIYTHIAGERGMWRGHHARPPPRHRVHRGDGLCMAAPRPRAGGAGIREGICGGPANGGGICLARSALWVSGAGPYRRQLSVIAPLVARDAGLGEIGRWDFDDPRAGPPVRLGVVTTDLPLAPDARGDDTSVLDFCRICGKCADNCPSRSIPVDDRREIDGALRWQIDAASCFRYWNSLGTDCGRCMAVCPYSHPDNAAHNVVRWAIRRSGGGAAGCAVVGRCVLRPPAAPRPAPAWTSAAD